MKRVLIAEEAPGLRQLLLEMLPKMFPDWEPIAPDSLGEAEQRFRTELFALALLDVDHGGARRGLDVLREWTALPRRCPVVATTLSPALLPEIWALNPAEVLLKPWDIHEIRPRLSRAAASQAAPAPTSAARVDGIAVLPEFTFAGATITPDLRCRLPDGHIESLGVKEYGILACFASAPQSLILREQLLREVWGTDANSQSNSINVYLSRLRKLFAEHGGTFEQNVSTEAKIGWRIVDRK